MSEAPERIVAWTHKYRHDRLWADEMLPEVAATVGATEYVRADRIEELESKLSLRTNLHEECIYLLKSTEAKLAKAVEEFTAIDTLDPEGMINGCSNAALAGLVMRMGTIARTTLAELTGGNDDNP